MKSKLFFLLIFTFMSTFLLGRAPIEYGRVAIDNVVVKNDWEKEETNVIIYTKERDFEILHLSYQEIQVLMPLLKKDVLLDYASAGLDYSDFGKVAYDLHVVGSGINWRARNFDPLNLDLSIPQDGARHVYEWKDHGTHYSFLTEGKKLFHVYGQIDRTLENGEEVYIEMNSEVNCPNFVNASEYQLQTGKDGLSFVVIGDSSQRTVVISSDTIVYGSPNEKEMLVKLKDYNSLPSVQWLPPEEFFDRLFIKKGNNRAEKVITGESVYVYTDASEGLGLDGSVNDVIFVLDNGNFYNLTRNKFLPTTNDYRRLYVMKEIVNSIQSELSTEFTIWPNPISK